MTTTLELTHGEIIRLTELLVGAAHADNEYHVFEQEKIKEIIMPFVHDRELAEEVARRMIDFDPVDFSIEEACAELDMTTAEERSAVFSMIVDVIEADDIHDFAESDYLVAVGEALGAAPEEYEHYTVEIIPVEG